MGIDMFLHDPWADRGLGTFEPAAEALDTDLKVNNETYNGVIGELLLNMGQSSTTPKTRSYWYQSKDMIQLKGANGKLHDYPLSKAQQREMTRIANEMMKALKEAYPHVAVIARPDGSIGYNDPKGRFIKLPLDSVPAFYPIHKQYVALRKTILANAIVHLLTRHKDTAAMKTADALRDGNCIQNYSKKARLAHQSWGGWNLSNLSYCFPSGIGGVGRAIAKGTAGYFFKPVALAAYNHGGAVLGSIAQLLGGVDLLQWVPAVAGVVSETGSILPVFGIVDDPENDSIMELDELIADLQARQLIRADGSSDIEGLSDFYLEFQQLNRPTTFSSAEKIALDRSPLADGGRLRGFGDTYARVLKDRETTWSPLRGEFWKGALERRGRTLGRLGKSEIASIEHKELRKNFDALENKLVERALAIGGKASVNDWSVVALREREEALNRLGNRDVENARILVHNVETSNRLTLRVGHAHRIAREATLVEMAENDEDLSLPEARAALNYARLHNRSLRKGGAIRACEKALESAEERLGRAKTNLARVEDLALRGGAALAYPDRARMEAEVANMLANPAAAHMLTRDVMISMIKRRSTEFNNHPFAAAIVSLKVRNEIVARFQTELDDAIGRISILADARAVNLARANLLAAKNMLQQEIRQFAAEAHLNQVALAASVPNLNDAAARAAHTQAVVDAKELEGLAKATTFVVDVPLVKEVFIRHHDKLARLSDNPEGLKQEFQKMYDSLKRKRVEALSGRLDASMRWPRFWGSKVLEPTLEEKQALLDLIAFTSLVEDRQKMAKTARLFTEWSQGILGTPKVESLEYRTHLTSVFESASSFQKQMLLRTEAV